ncbi:Uu.00g095490.m01.CDS01 [Anthostomella pinea]|uniref:Uu.00g095490.m01.CDS01 n=1 Tax=Anthostomella pinea TaxID=933095 RepID=A0AAI8YEU6_9PEZI|nr:Uu.00g095490.m01.CDS01 [Anthostomella pinea]
MSAVILAYFVFVIQVVVVNAVKLDQLIVYQITFQPVLVVEVVNNVVLAENHMTNRAFSQANQQIVRGIE